MRSPFLRPVFPLLILFAIPLAFSLKWVAIHFPIDSIESFSRSVWIDDRYVIVQQSFPAYLANYHYEPDDCRFREYLIDCELATQTELGGEVCWDHGIALPKIAPDKTIVRVSGYSDKFPGWILQSTKLPSLQSRTESIGEFFGFVVGGRFVLQFVDGQQTLMWRDACNNHAIGHCPLDTSKVGQEIEVYGTAAFCLLTPERAVNDEHSLNVGVDRTWELELYSMNESGPQFVAKWPVVTRQSTLQVCVATNRVCSMSLDERTIDIHEIDSGKIISSIPVENGWMKVDFPPSCRSVLWANGRNYDVVDGKEIPITDRTIIDRTENYLLAYTGLNEAENVASIGVFDANGKLLSEHSLITDPLLRHEPKFSVTGNQLKYIDESNRALFLDAISGRTVKIVDPSIRNRLFGYGIGILVGAWTIVFLLECIRSELPAYLFSTVVIAGLFTFAIYRVRQSGNEHLYDRLAWQVIYASTIAGGMRLVQFLMTSRTGFGNKLLIATTFLYVCYQGEVRLVDQWKHWMVFCQFTLASVLLLCWGAVARRFNLFQETTSERQRRASIGSLFTWVTLCSLLVAWATEVEWNGFSPNWNLNWLDSVDPVLRVTVAIVTWWSAIKFRQQPLVSITATLVVIACALPIHSYVIAMEVPSIELFWTHRMRYACYCVLTIVGIVGVGFLDSRQHRSKTDKQAGRGEPVSLMKFPNNASHRELN